MLGLFYIFLCFLTGVVFCSIFFPRLKNITEVSFDGKKLKLSSYFVLLPAWYYTGSLILSWTTYLLAYSIGSKGEPLFRANLIVLPVFLIIFLLLIGIRVRKYIVTSGEINTTASDTTGRPLGASIIKGIVTHVSSTEWVFLLGVFLLALILMWSTFFIKGDKLYVGLTVFGDFSPHLGMIRSFSEGNNFPTWYSHFAGEDIRYHFMFLFMVGNLEYLGLPLDFAFNIPSMLSFIGAFMLLYVLGVKVSGRKMAGYLTCLFFAFRSSSSLFTFLTQIPKGSSISQALKSNSVFIGNTPNESWGLFNLNVYCNQRHLAFSLGIMLLAIILFLPHLYNLFDRLRNNKSVKEFTCNFILDKNTWVIKDTRLAIGVGLILGMIAFWNGSVLIATLASLFLVGICSGRRLELLLSAVIAVVLTFLQSGLFIHGKAVNPTYFFGFISENKTVFGVADYLIRLLGILPIVLFAAFLVNNGIKRYLTIVFLMPLILTFTLSLTVDVTVNHKFLMMSVMLLGVIISDYLVRLLKRKDVILKIGIIFIIVLMTASGIYDFCVLVKQNNPKNSIVLSLDSELTKWVENNSDSKDIYLTSNYSLNQIVLGGGMLFEGWQYYGWSAGYDTPGRDLLVKEMYEAATREELSKLVEQNNIRFIVVDYDNRNSESYSLNEVNIANTFACVYTEGTEDYKLSIYDTRILLSKD
ncbi:MAG: putative rane protein [Anaerocolumna sp.]|jgi:hypothetical protein|nr:putative rane protein [Anaerocolumna sp.]